MPAGNTPAEDLRWLAAAASLAERARPLANPNPGVGAIIVADGVVVGRGWTQPGGRPHAEAVALAQAGDSARGGTLYVTLEPCAHLSERGPACADLVAVSGLVKVVVGMADPDPRTAGAGIERLRARGISVAAVDDSACHDSLAGYSSQRITGRPHVTLKIAVSLDGCIATASGESKWITGAAARAHTHRERARADAILVGGGTLRADNPSLDVRLAGLESRSPRRLLLSRKSAPAGWERLANPGEIWDLQDVQYLLIEGGRQVTSAFLNHGWVDRLLIYRAPIIIGGGIPAIGDVGNVNLDEARATGGYRLHQTRRLGRDVLEIYTPALVEGN